MNGGIGPSSALAIGVVAPKSAAADRAVRIAGNRLCMERIVCERRFFSVDDTEPSDDLCLFARSFFAHFRRAECLHRQTTAVQETGNESDQIRDGGRPTDFRPCDGGAGASV